MFTVGNMSVPDCCEVVTGEIRIFSGEFSELGTVGFSADGNVPALILGSLPATKGNEYRITKLIASLIRASGGR